jgi:hypothetical protein
MEVTKMVPRTARDSEESHTLRIACTYTHTHTHTHTHTAHIT